MIDIENVSLTYGNRQVLKNVTLHIEDGETLVIIGASGSGKSTLLKLIIGLLKPNEGHIFVDGKDVTAMTEAELNEERKRMGMVFQYSALFDSMSVGENVAFGLRRHRKMTESQIQSIVKEKLSLVGLSKIENMMPANLSGGMQKRVGLARAITLNPQIILYDEPTSGLDPIRSADISILIRNIQKELHSTSIVVTHDLKSAETVADKIAFLYEGTFLKIGTVEELYDSSDIRVKQFMNGMPSNNLALERE